MLESISFKLISNKQAMYLIDFRTNSFGIQVLKLSHFRVMIFINLSNGGWGKKGRLLSLYINLLIYSRRLTFISSHLNWMTC